MNSVTSNKIQAVRLNMRSIFAALFLSLLTIQASAQGVTSDTILIGQSAALSGPAEQLGMEMKAGAEAYFKTVNDAGGINGRKIKLISLDDGYEPDRAKANTLKLINDEKVLALFGYVGTPTSNAAVPIFTEAKVPFIGAFTGAQSLREPFNRYIFNVRASYFDETEEIVRHLTQQGIKKISVLYQNDAYGKAGLAGMERTMKKRNLQLAGTATVERNSTDVSAAVATLGKIDAPAVVMISAYKSCAAFINQTQASGKAPLFWNVSFVGSKALSQELGESGRGVHISQVVPFPWSSESKVVREYQRDIGGEANYSFTSLEGYLAAKVLVVGLKKAGKNLNREPLVEALANSGTTDFGGFKFTYGADDHNGSDYVDLTIISKNGTFRR
jgi:branched-chain amino acid transport system substrate-binding protein